MHEPSIHHLWNRNASRVKEQRSSYKQLTSESPRSSITLGLFASRNVLHRWRNLSLFLNSLITAGLLIPNILGVVSDPVNAWSRGRNIHISSPNIVVVFLMSHSLYHWISLQQIWMLYFVAHSGNGVVEVLKGLYLHPKLCRFLALLTGLLQCLSELLHGIINLLICKQIGIEKSQSACWFSVIPLPRVSPPVDFTDLINT